MIRRWTGVCLWLVACAGVPVRAATIYATASDPTFLYSINSISGVVSPVGPYALVNNPANEFGIGGLEFAPDGTLYGVSVGPAARLYTLSTSTGAATPVGSLNLNNVFEGGLTFDPTSGTAYAVVGGSAPTPGLFTINLVTGQAMSVGVIGGGMHDFNGLAFNPSGQLFGIDGATNALWRIDKTNPGGAGTFQVGSGLGPGIALGDVGGMTFDFGTNTAFGYASGSRTLFTVNLTTGTGTVIHTLNAPTDPLFWSLATPIPEPAAISLGMVMAIFILRRRKP